MKLKFGSDISIKIDNWRRKCQRVLKAETE